MTEQEILKQFDAPEGAVLDKVFKNGNIKIKRKTTCWRCGNKEGIYYIGVMNGVPQPSWVDGGVCFRCGGKGWEWESEILMTPENKAKHDAKVAKEREKQAEKQKELDIARLIEEEERQAREAEEARKREEEEIRIRELKAMSNFRGTVGEKFEEMVTYLGSAHFDVKSYSGFGVDRMYVHNFRDDKGNKLVWKTTKGLSGEIEPRMRVNLKATIKEHSVYKDEKQTSIIRCKVSR